MDEKTAIKKKYTAEKQNIVIDLISEGKTFAEATQKVGISRSLEWCERKANDVYAEKIETAKELRIQSVEGKLYDLCMEGNITAIIFFLKCNRPSKYAIGMTQPIDERIRFQVSEIEMI